LLALRNSIQHPDSGRGIDERGASPPVITDPIKQVPSYLKVNNSLQANISKVASLPRIVMGPDKALREFREANARASLDEASLRLNRKVQ